MVFRLWLMLWVICLPLVHIHPEADHAHGMAGHSHGGTFHTVLSSDPICAYEDHRHHHNSFAHGEPLENSDSSPHPLHGLEHANYGFFVLNSSLTPIGDGNLSDVSGVDLAVSGIESPTESGVSNIPLFLLSRTPSSILIRSLSPRAPPFHLL